MSAWRGWSVEDDAFLRGAYPSAPTSQLAQQLGRSLSTTYQRAFRLGLAKSPAYLASPAAGRLSSRDQRGISTRFSKGQIPFNKGLRRPGWSPGRMRETQFRKGERRGVAAKLWKPIGAERVSKDGYLERKINNDLPLQRRWRAVHLLVWEEANGPVSPDHVIVFMNRNKRDVQLENLECISRRDLMQRNTVHNLPKPVAQAVQLLGALNRQIRRRQRAHEKQD